MKSKTKKNLKYVLLTITTLIVSVEIVLAVLYHYIYVPWIPPFIIPVYDTYKVPAGTGVPPPASALHLIYPADPSSDKIIMGASHNVFVGRVIKQEGNKETEIGPRTQYSVEVVDNIKGEVGNTVIVDMLGGYDKYGKLIVVEEGGLDSFLQPGVTYLFATRYNEQENWYTLIAHPNARKILSTDANASIAELKTLVEKDQKFKTWEAAYPNEILDIADIGSNNTKNNFKSLPPEVKAAAQSRADHAKASLAAKSQ